MLTSSLITTRHGFFTRSTSDNEHVRKSLGASELILAKQIHSSTALLINKPGVYEGDALVTTTQGIAVAVYTADCGPILLCDKKAGVIAAAHAGWPGARNGIIDSVISVMQKAGAKDIVAALGPCIHQRSYEVGPEFFTNFISESKDNEKFFSPSTKPGHFMFDLPGYIEMKLRAAGVNSIEVLPQDTLSHPDQFHSFRRSTIAGIKEPGRQLSAICLSPKKY